MSKVLNNLVNLLSLEQVEQGLFRGQSQDLGFGHVFGGQVMGQALSAARQTVVDDRKVHSFHSYFLRAGDEKQDIIYEVENLRDGGSFSARSIKAIQKGRAIFYMTCSFQKQEQGFDHQTSMPKVPEPETLQDQRELAMTMREKIPAKILERFIRDSPIEMRLVTPVDPVTPGMNQPIRQVWIRASGHLPDNEHMHHYLLSYASDFNFLVTAAQPHNVSFITPGMRMATIDHAMWFYRKFNMEQWLLYSIDSPNAIGGRGFVRGQFFNQQGDLVASTAQEGLMRLTDP